eukprot:gene21031-27257_t
MNEISKISNNAIVNFILPVCITPTSKTTVINDPTAGMNEKEIQDYISNVGGGLCGYPDYIRDFVGVGINLSLITLGILSLGYIILGGYQFALEKDVETLMKPFESNFPDALTKGSAAENDDLENSTIGVDGNVISPDGLNRSQRRLKLKLDTKKKTDE